MEASTPRRMVIRRTTPLGDRRRRVVLDESEASRNGTTVKPERTHPPRRYSAAAQREAQPRLFECIPTRRWSLCVWLLFSNTFAVGHATLHVLCDQASRWGWKLDFSAFRMNGAQNIAHASQTLTFLLCAIYCGLTVQFRRHRIDDYRGKYRIWYSVAVLSAFFSLNAASNFASLPWQLLVYASSRLGLGGPIWPVGFVCLLALPLLGRLLLEIWSCRWAVASLVVSFSFFCVSLGLPLFLPEDVNLKALTTGLCRLLAGQWLLFALVLNARHVFLDAQNELPSSVRPAAKRSRKSANPSVAAVSASRRDSTLEGTQVVESPQKQTPSPENHSKSVSAPSIAAATKAVTPQQGLKPSLASSASSTPTAKREFSVPPVSTSSDELDDEDASASTLSMSRAERKRVRKEQQKSRRAA